MFHKVCECYLIYIKYATEANNVIEPCPRGDVKMKSISVESVRRSLEHRVDVLGILLNSFYFLTLKICLRYCIYRCNNNIGTYFTLI